MDMTTLGIIAIVAMLVLLFLRVPIAIAMGIPGIIILFTQGGWTLLSGVTYSIIWNHALSYTLVTVPMFVLMGELLYVSGITANVYTAVRTWLWRLRGGLAVATIGASAIFAAASGSSVATVGTLGRVASEEMRVAKYDDRLASGAIVAGGGLGILIPPSTALILYGLLTDESIGKLFIAGLLPGLILTGFFIITIILVVTAFPNMASKAERVPVASHWPLLGSVGLILAVFVVVIGGLYMGLVSVTEASGLGAAIALIAGIVTRKLNLAKTKLAVMRSVRTTGFIFAIIIGAFLLNHVLATTRVANKLTAAIVGLDVPTVWIFVGIVILYLILGALMDTFAMIVITVPIVVPIILALGFDSIWFGIVLVVLIEIALITPPIGMNIFVLKGVAPTIPMGKMFSGAAIFMVPMLVLIALLYAFPDIALFLTR